MVDFLTKAGRFLGIDNQEGVAIGSQLAQGNILGAGLTTLASLGGENRNRAVPITPIVDTSGPPAGVDSVATTAPISQTSQTIPFDGRMLGGPGSGAQTAFVGGSLIPKIITDVGRLLGKGGAGGALTGIGLGVGAGVVTDMFGNQKKLVITRKLQREVKKVFMMSGGDLGFVSNNSMMLFGKDLSPDQVLMVLFKTFKNQGPFVTKAAVRKTRSTIRKMETLCDLKDRMCPPKPARRRAAPRKMSTSITQVK
tara:strand:- start:1202 stop:1960 length:759 start_codon:yes stop_codon:yes gene_type:complete